MHSVIFVNKAGFEPATPPWSEVISFILGFEPMSSPSTGDGLPIFLFVHKLSSYLRLPNLFPRYGTLINYVNCRPQLECYNIRPDLQRLFTGLILPDYEATSSSILSYSPFSGGFTLIVVGKEGLEPPIYLLVKN